MWSGPRRITERILNSYKLETLEGQPLDGEYHARRLREFIPREGTELATQQKEWEARQTAEHLEGERDKVASQGEGTEAVED
jgi:hypothetical protein